MANRDRKKNLLQKAAGEAVKKTLGESEAEKGKVSGQAKSFEQVPEDSSRLKESGSKEGTLDQEKEDSVSENEIRSGERSGSYREKHLPKKDGLFRINNYMRIDEYTQARTEEPNANKKWLRIVGGVLFVLLIWWIWPSGHEIYMDVEKMTPERISKMSSEKEYHFAIGQDFFIYYKRGGWFSPKRIKVLIYKVDSNREEISVQEKEFKKSKDKFQTYYDDSFFEEEGNYEVEVKDEDDEVLITKKFTID
ncbi:hypothetical protein CH373_01695 [Leptospira perolatii]|uniref:Uncharacterized protein n=1 Tax=Leptospira perolatii TaxID=2023191 RepID=A0A2M9ZS31_9LEPT|nr:hypothetical protein [Leptospira perolatii]PJZ71248.1 hypothetical protein CH360_01695 [Leptospira perolatii]PJZ74781.1 hypothetical protein CH373_01695 [Leptospira perolatii]